MNGFCDKCGGLLVVERVMDFYAPSSGWKCVNCGWCRRDHSPPAGEAIQPTGARISEPSDNPPRGTSMREANRRNANVPGSLIQGVSCIRGKGSVNRSPKEMKSWRRPCEAKGK